VIKVAGASTRGKIASAEQLLLDVLGRTAGDPTAPPLSLTLRRAEGPDCQRSDALEVVDVLTATITLIRESVRCHHRGRA